MEQKFKVGDRVKVIRESVEEDQHLIGMVGKIVKAKYDYKTYEVDFEKKIEQFNNNVNETTHNFYERELELVKKGKLIKPKTPSHLVVWEEDDDPCKFFESEEKANEFIKELSKKDDVVKDSIILVEIKSAKRITIQKTLRKTNYTI